MKGQEMKAHERMKALFHGERIDRLPVMEWAPWWDKTIARWYGEGLPKELQSVYDIDGYFGLDRCIQTYYAYSTAQTPPPPHHGAPIITNLKEYEQIKPTLYPDVTKRYDKAYYDFLRKSREDGDTVHFFTVEGFFWWPRTLLGIEPHLYSFYDEPELLEAISEDMVEYCKKVFEFVGNTFSFDFMSFAEDMSYNNGPMLSKEMFDAFLAPYYRKLIPILKKMDIPVFVDSDGDITLAVDWYGSVGADGMFPLERQAGVDVALYIKKQPDMFFLGHFDKMCMKFGEEAMRKEFERLLPSMQSKHFIPSVDHQTPPDVSIDNYRIYVRLLNEYARKIK